MLLWFHYSAFRLLVNGLFAKKCSSHKTKRRSRLFIGTANILHHVPFLGMNPNHREDAVLVSARPSPGLREAFLKGGSRFEIKPKDGDWKTRILRRFPLLSFPKAIFRRRSRSVCVAMQIKNLQIVYTYTFFENRSPFFGLC